MGEEAAERAAFKAHAKRYTVYQIALRMSARKKRCGKGLLIAHLQYTIQLTHTPFIRFMTFGKRM